MSHFLCSLDRFTRRTLVLTAAVALTAFTGQAQAPHPDQLREEAEHLELRAQQLRELGRARAAEASMDEARGLRERAERLQRGAGLRTELQQERERLLAELTELRAAGREMEAGEVKARIMELERHLEELELRAAGDERGLRRPSPDRPSPGPRPPRPQAIQERIHHLQMAMENLRMAGLPQVAERLTGELERMHQQMARRGGPEPERPPGVVPTEELRQLRAEMEELRRGLNELRRHIKETESR